MSVRAKFRVAHVTDYGNNFKEVHLTAVYDDGIPENARFNKVTPTGTLTMTINNPPASDVFTPGKEFYLDFRAVQEAGRPTIAELENILQQDGVEVDILPNGEACVR